MDHLPTIYGAAVLLPLASFVTILLFAQQLGKVASSIATGAILLSAALSFLGFGIWLTNHPPQAAHHGGHEAAHDAEHGDHGKDAKGEKHSSWRGSSPLFVSLVQETAAKAQEAHAHVAGAHDEHAAASK